MQQTYRTDEANSCIMTIVITKYRIVYQYSRGETPQSRRLLIQLYDSSVVTAFNCYLRETAVN